MRPRVAAGCHLEVAQEISEFLVVRKQHRQLEILPVGRLSVCCLRCTQNGSRRRRESRRPGPLAPAFAVADDKVGGLPVALRSYDCISLGLPALERRGSTCFGGAAGPWQARTEPMHAKRAHSGEINADEHHKGSQTWRLHRTMRSEASADSPHVVHRGRPPAAPRISRSPRNLACESEVTYRTTFGGPH
jgi:hypothetical protein